MYCNWPLKANECHLRTKNCDVLKRNNLCLETVRLPLKSNELSAFHIHPYQLNKVHLDTLAMGKSR